MLRLIKQLLSPPVREDIGHPRLSSDEWPAVVYAIGDVHGCHAELMRLEAIITADAASVAGEKWLIMLGDYVDRGPASADVLHHLCRPPPEGFRRVCLLGNHEAMMLDFLANPRNDSSWLRFGGIETLRSYGIDEALFAQADLTGRRSILDDSIPPDHVAFMSSLPIMLSLPGMVFVHAGIRPNVAIEAQQDEDLIWIREAFLGLESHSGPRVVHGHTPSDRPSIRSHRIGIDTAAFATGILTAVRMDRSGTLSFFDTAEV